MQSSSASIRSYDKKWEPAKGKVLIEVEYSGVNPTDIKHRFARFHKYIAGHDYAEIIIELGEGIDQKFNVGNKFRGFGALSSTSRRNAAPTKISTSPAFIHKILSNVFTQDASNLPFVAHVANNRLFN